MTQKTREALKTQKNTLYGTGQPLVSKVGSSTLFEDLLDSVPTKSDDATRWMKPVQALQRVPPGVLTEGHRYIIGNSPTGAWAGQAWKLAEVVAGAWTFTALQNGQHYPCLLFENTVYAVDYGIAYVRHFDRAARSRNLNSSILTSTTLQLFAGVEGFTKSGRSYDFRTRFHYACEDATTGIQLQLDGPAAATIAYRLRVVMADGTERVTFHNTWFAGEATDGVPTEDVVLFAEITGTVIEVSEDYMIAAMVRRTNTAGPVNLPKGSFFELIDITEIG